MFDRLRVQSLKLEPEKCEFLRKEFYFLGHKITADGVAMDKRKVPAIKNYPVPTNKRQLKSLLRTAGSMENLYHVSARSPPLYIS